MRRKISKIVRTSQTFNVDGGRCEPARRRSINSK
jgi:hypothetical protein